MNKKLILEQVNEKGVLRFYLHDDLTFEVVAHEGTEYERKFTMKRRAIRDHARKIMIDESEIRKYINEQGGIDMVFGILTGFTEEDFNKIAAVFNEIIRTNIMVQ